jgi:hypothetical protein
MLGGVVVVVNVVYCGSYTDLRIPSTPSHGGFVYEVITLPPSPPPPASRLRSALPIHGEGVES